MRWDRESLAALISVGINVFLVFLKLLLAVLSGSLALLADAFHSGSDVFVSLIVFIGIRVSKRKTVSSPTRIKIENTIAVIISIFIWFSAYVIFKEAIAKKVTEIEILPIAIFGSFISVIITYFL